MKIKFIFTIILFLTLFSLFSLNVLAEGEKQQNWASSYINNSPLNNCLGIITPLFISSTDISFAFSPILTVHLGLSSIPLEFIEGVGFGIGYCIISA